MSECDDPEMRRIVQVAAAWKSRQDAGLTPAEEGALLHWLEEDSRHADAFGEVDATWSLLDRARELSPTELRDPLALPEHPTRLRRRRSVGLWIATGLGVAAALAVIFVSSRSPADAPRGFQEIAMVEAGVVRRFNLPDGSTVWVNSSSEVVIDLAEKERRVKLARGEAHFEVAKDIRRPFIVSVSGIDVRAVGTAFDVALRHSAVEVVVTEGQVQVADSVGGGSLLPATPNAGTAAADRLLVAGEQALIPLGRAAHPGVVAVRELPPAAVIEKVAWTSRRLNFDAATLAEIVAEFNRFNRHQLNITDRALAQQRFSGSFQSDDPDTFVSLLQTRVDIAVERKRNETVLRLVSPR